MPIQPERRIVEPERRIVEPVIYQQSFNKTGMAAVGASAWNFPQVDFNFNWKPVEIVGALLTCGAEEATAHNGIQVFQCFATLTSGENQSLSGADIFERLAVTPYDPTVFWINAGYQPLCIRLNGNNYLQMQVSIQTAQLTAGEQPYGYYSVTFYYKLI